MYTKAVVDVSCQYCRLYIAWLSNNSHVNRHLLKSVINKYIISLCCNMHADVVIAMICDD